MADYDRRERTTTTVEYVIPDRGHGACWVEVSKAISAAYADLYAAGRFPEGADVPDDVIRIRPGDDEIIVSFVLKEGTT